MVRGVSLTPLRERIKNKALFWSRTRIGGTDADGRIRGTEHMMRMYQETISGPASLVLALRQAHARKLIEDGTAAGLWISKSYRPELLQDNPRLPPYRSMMVDLPEKSLGIMWCGIFATWVLKQAGVSVSWHQGLRSDEKRIKLIHLGEQTPRSVLDELAPGDVCVTDHNGLSQHYVVIVEAAPGEDTVEVVEGNWPLPRHTVRQSNAYRKNHFHTLYKIQEQDWHANRIDFGDGRWGYRHL